MPIYWALGYHLCRWGYNTSDSTWEIVKNMRNNKIPQVKQVSRKWCVLCRRLSYFVINWCVVVLVSALRTSSGTTSTTWTSSWTSPSTQQSLRRCPTWSRICTLTTSATSWSWYAAGICACICVCCVQGWVSLLIYWVDSQGPSSIQSDPIQYHLE